MNNTVVIAHRGNLFGPNPVYENRPEYIDFAIKEGFVAEVDLRANNSGMLFLGHDKGQYDTNLNWLLERSKHLIVHCKDLPALQEVSRYTSIHYFYHENDPYTITSQGFIWAHPDVEVPKATKVIAVNTNGTFNIDYYKVYGVCTDYVMFMKDKLK
jgi:hypothetical protein